MVEVLATDTTITRLVARPLTAEAFAPFGQVIEHAPGGRRLAINDGSCVRHHDLARPQASAPGAISLSLFEASATPLPAALRLVERHRLGSQAFAPFGAALAMLLVVADAALAPGDIRPEHLQAFVTSGQQGVQLHPGVWHHPLLSLQSGTWLVADRVADQVDCDVVSLARWQLHCAP
ncbi:MAG: ureidoglycolate lyase [Burkholderiaceae bacterium]|jgi:ureidoglycolate lyase|nr:ureidoglycolate lyase [Burkholderiaceae bacterium]